MDDFEIASMMVCGRPSYINGRHILSASDAVWEPVKSLPDDLRDLFTDDLGNRNVRYPGFLQILDLCVLDNLDDRDLFACFRAVQRKIVGHVSAFPPVDLYRPLMKRLKLAGWDVCTGNGWRSASCDGFFPIDPFDGHAVDDHAYEINEFGLFRELSHSLEYCSKNDEGGPEDSPWYPVGVYITARSYARLKKVAQSS